VLSPDLWRPPRVSCPFLLASVNRPVMDPVTEGHVLAPYFDLNPVSQ
jgi:hypothetical protein